MWKLSGRVPEDCVEVFFESFFPGRLRLFRKAISVLSRGWHRHFKNNYFFFFHDRVWAVKFIGVGHAHFVVNHFLRWG